MKRSRTVIPWCCVALAGLGLIATSATGQTQQGDRRQTAVVAATELPDSPGALLVSNSSASDSTSDPLDAPVVPTRDIESTSVLVPARKYHRVVRPYEEAVPLTGFDKIKLSIISRATIGEVAGTAWAAGWSQWRDSRPHYGTDSEAFEKRLGALALKQTSQSFFTYGVYAAAFHDDPRYYVMGPTMKPLKRLIYSAERTIVTQKDDGSPAFNWPKLAGIATSTALTTAYYPAVDHGFGNESKAFATSLATSILNDELHEFGGDLIHMIRHNK
jgi:hypothetical protein